VSTISEEGHFLVLPRNSCHPKCQGGAIKSDALTGEHFAPGGKGACDKCISSMRYCARKASVTMPPSIACAGAGACTTALSQARGSVTEFA
jgi:hypothetical protein